MGHRKGTYSAQVFRKVQERHQVDLVSVASMPETIDGDITSILCQ